MSWVVLSFPLYAFVTCVGTLLIIISVVHPTPYTCNYKFCKFFFITKHGDTTTTDYSSAHRLSNHDSYLHGTHTLDICDYLLTSWCRVLLEKLTGLQLVKKFPAFYGTRRFITALTSVRHLSLSWTRPIQSIYPHPTSGDPS